MNCLCNNTFDLRCVCYPREDYRKLVKDPIHNRYFDFRKCPMRFTYAMDFILNDYYKYNLIENATTEKDKIKILKNIIIKDYKLTNADFTTILENYLVTEDNLINNYKEPDEPIEIYIPDEIWKHIKEFMIDYKFKKKLPSYKKIYEIFAEHHYWNCNDYWEDTFIQLERYFNDIFKNKILRKISLGLLKINVEILQKIYDKEIRYLTKGGYNCNLNTCHEEELSKISNTKNILFYIRWILIVLYKQEDRDKSPLAHRLLTWYIL